MFGWLSLIYSFQFESALITFPNYTAISLINQINQSHSSTTLTFELNIHRVKVNQNAKYLDQRSLDSKTVVRTYTHTGPRALVGLL